MKGIKLNRGTSTILIIYNGQTGDLLLENRITQTFWSKPFIITTSNDMSEVWNSTLDDL